MLMMTCWTRIKIKAREETEKAHDDMRRLKGRGWKSAKKLSEKKEEDKIE